MNRNLSMIFLATFLQVGSVNVQSGSHPTPKQGRQYLVEDGIPKAQIVISRKAPATVFLAARELQTAIRKMSGATLPFKTTVDSSIIFKVYVGRSNYTDSLGITSEGCIDGGFKMLSAALLFNLLGTFFNFLLKVKIGLLQILDKVLVLILKIVNFKGAINGDS